MFSGGPVKVAGLKELEGVTPPPGGGRGRGRDRTKEGGLQSQELLPSENTFLYLLFKSEGENREYCRAPGIDQVLK